MKMLAANINKKPEEKKPDCFGKCTPSWMCAPEKRRDCPFGNICAINLCSRGK